MYFIHDNRSNKTIRRKQHTNAAMIDTRLYLRSGAVPRQVTLSRRLNVVALALPRKHDVIHKTRSI